MKTVAPLLAFLAFIVATGCSGAPDVPAASDRTPELTAEPTTSPTVIPETATASTMPRFPPIPPTDLTGLPGVMTEAIEAVLAGDEYVAYLTTVGTPCVVPESGLLPPPQCPEGTTAGTLAPGVLFGACPDQDLFFLDPSARPVAPVDQMSHLTGVVRLTNGPAEYFAIFGAERASWLAFDEAGALIGAGGGGSCAAFELRDRLVGADWVTGGIEWGFDDDLGPPLYEALVRPVMAGPGALARLTETVDSLCSFHGSINPACADEGLGPNDYFQGVIVSDLLFCEACAMTPAELIEMLRPMYQDGFGPSVSGAWRLGPGGQQLISSRWPELTPTVALAFDIPGEPAGDEPIGFLLFVDPTQLHIDPTARPVALVERFTRTWTAADTAHALGSWEQIYPLP
jgi:hypothetical protein